MEFTQQEVELKRIGVLSTGVLFGAMYAIIGLIAGIIISIIAIGASSQFGQAGFGGFLFGAGAVIALPIFYGIMGFIGGILMAAIYNLVAKYTGGIELEFDLS